MDYLQAAQRIRETRKLKGLSQAGLAEKTGLAVMSIRRYETAERKPTLSIFKVIAQALDIDVNWLMNGQTLEERDAAYKARVGARFAEAKVALEHVTANIAKRTTQLNYGGRLRLSDYADDLYKVADYRTTRDADAPADD